MKVFTLGEVLSITTGKLFCPMSGIYKILNHLTGESLYTHQLSRAIESCRPYVLEMFPALTSLDTTGVDGENGFAWLQEQSKKYGEIFPLAPMPEGLYTVKNPIDELREMVPEKKIIVVSNP